ncbi:MFS transporter [Bacillus sp. M6-12]|uniref:MFS transporter n=1 Tax=Bacillus sp. M6-12 TaxID=2054166 RepID=UPI000C780B08|nr:MFS transporter [Bacillus sp. M6-12]PLS16784.1 MFS transporter [Bacillus sp. M6-12]
MGRNTYLTKVLTIHWLIWGFVALDRLIIGYAMPAIAPELHLNQAQISWIFAVLSISWGFFAYIGGGVSDQIGRKRVIVPATFIFTLLSWGTGFVKSFGAMLGVRALMGAAEGAYYPSATALLTDVADKEKRGMVIGIHQSAFPLMGGLLGPLYVTAVIGFFHDWRMVFYLTLIPGIILAIVHWKFVNESPKVTIEHAASTSVKVNWTEPFKSRNVILTTIIMIFFMSWTILFIVFGATYLTQERGLSLGVANGIMSAWGIGAFLGMPILSSLSDRVGRKKVLITGMILCGVFTLLFFFSPTNFWALFILMLLAGGFGQGVYPIFTALIPAESVPEHVKGAAIGVPLAVGEIIGGGFFPAIIATIAFNYGFGLSFIGILSGIAVIVCAFIAFGIKETISVHADTSQNTITHH